MVKIKRRRNKTYGIKADKETRKKPLPVGLMRPQYES